MRYNSFNVCYSYINETYSYLNTCKNQSFQGLCLLKQENVSRKGIAKIFSKHCKCHASQTDHSARKLLNYAPVLRYGGMWKHIFVFSDINSAHQNWSFSSPFYSVVALEARVTALPHANCPCLGISQVLNAGSMGNEATFTAIIGQCIDCQTIIIQGFLLCMFCKEQNTRPEKKLFIAFWGKQFKADQKIDAVFNSSRKTMENHGCIYSGKY